MRISTHVGWAMLVLLFPAPAAVAQGASADTGYSARFVCPESLPSPEARQAAVQAFIGWAVQAHPAWTLDQFMAYRMALLVSHGCEETLKSIRKQKQAQDSADRARPAES